MKNKLILVLALIGAINSSINTTHAQGTAFTYQGQLQNNGSPANGNYDLTFALFNTNSTNAGQVGSTLTNLEVGVTNGLFSVPLDFGNQFPGASRWLSIGVRTNGGSGFTALNPLQELTPTPYAIYASDAGTAANLTGTVPLAQLPAPVVTNGAGGVNLTGSFTGNGGGLTNLNASQLTSGSVPDSALSNNVALLNRTPQNFTGTNTFAANIGIGTSTPEFPLDLAATLGGKLSLYSEAGGNGYGFGIQAGLLQIHSDQSGSDVAIGYGPSTNFTERTRVKGNGNVGIGTTTPAAPLDVFSSGFPSALIDGSHIYGTWLDLRNTSAGGTNWIIINTGSGNEVGKLEFATASAPNTTTGTPLTIQPNGYVGIGNTNPDRPLTVNGPGATPGEEYTYQGGIGTGTSQLILGYDTTDDVGVIAASTYGSEWKDLSICPGGGLVGIHTSTPQYGLVDIEGESGSYTQGSGTTGITYDVGLVQYLASADGGTSKCSLYASGDIVAGGALICASDQRIKHNIGRSNPANDLAALLGLEVTDYTYIDTIGKGNRPHKKVIAQQVEKVFPQAVSQSTNNVPDIYKRATVKDGWVQLATDLKVGERVKLITEKEQGDHEVLEVRDGAFRTNFKPKTDKVFVYGREVGDFRTVDYDAISMLNVSATQKPAKKLAAKDQEITKLQAQVSRLEQKAARAEALAQKLDDLQKQVAQLAAESRNARLALKSAPPPHAAAAVGPALTTASLQN